MLGCLSFRQTEDNINNLAGTSSSLFFAGLFLRGLMQTDDALPSIECFVCQFWTPKRSINYFFFIPLSLWYSSAVRKDSTCGTINLTIPRESTQYCIFVFALRMSNISSSSFSVIFVNFQITNSNRAGTSVNVL